ncbi:MAG: RNA-directed DNA polymerase, partial [Flavobacteriales bacterium]
AILSRKDMTVHTILEELNDQKNLIMKVNMKEGKNLILYCAYVPPDEDQENNLMIVKNNLKIMKERYKDLKLVFYADLNKKREELGHFQNELNENGFKLIYEKEVAKFTRMQMVLEKPTANYIDYFITHGILAHHAEFSINLPIGSSDHLTLKIEVNPDATGRILTNKVVREPFDSIRGASAGIGKLLIEAVNSEDNLDKLKELIDCLHFAYKLKVQKPKNIMKISKMVRDHLQENKDKSFRALRKIVQNSNKEEWASFMSNFETLRLSRNDKEYFLRLRFYSEIERNTGILKDLVIEDTDGSETVTVDRMIINDHLQKKYQRLFQDNGTKQNYFDPNDIVIHISRQEVENALTRLDLDKAISWDFIPGKSYEQIKLLSEPDRDNFYENLTRLLNTILKSDQMPEDLFTSRLLCLNKEATKAGNIESIRPIAVAGTFSKLIENVLLDRIQSHVYENRTKCINKNQVGFMKGGSCTLNLMKLRHKSNELKKTAKKDNHYVFFLDLKAAYDSVGHNLLFQKMENKGFDQEIINTVKKIYSAAKIRIDRLCNPINVNVGVLQGSLISPILFNVMIDDLISDLSMLAFDVLGYADDIAVICRTRDELENVIRMVESWSKTNSIEINRKKSGILVIRGHDEAKSILDIPVVQRYKYLGILIDKQLNCKAHTYEVNKRLQVYVKRNSTLGRKYFSPKSLIRIHNYFHKSRLVYGICAFADLKTPIIKVQSHLMNQIKSLFRMPVSTNNKRIRVNLAINDMETTLKLSLLKNYFKYIKMFGEEPSFYKDTLTEYFGSVTIKSENLTQFISDFEKRKLREEARSFEIELSDRYETIQKEKYNFPDKRDSLMLKFFSNVGFFSSRFMEKCKHCSSDNSRRHAVDDCTQYSSWRTRLLGELDKITNDELRNINDLNSKMDYIYYSGSNERNRRTKCLEVLKRYILEFYLTQEKEGKR